MTAALAVTHRVADYDAWYAVFTWTTVQTIEF